MSRTVRDVHSSQEKLRRYRAERLLRTGFVELRSKVLVVVRSRLRAKGVAIDRSDLEACYAQAWHALYAAVRAGEEIESPAAWLVLVTFRRALDESRSNGRAHPAPTADVAHATDPDIASQLDDRERLRHVFEAFRAGLSPRESQAASLCYLQGLTRAEAARELGVSERRMSKLMEGAGGRPGVAGKVAGLLETIGAGNWCEQQSSLVRAYAFGLLDPEGERHELAVAHCRECPACRAQVAFLRGLAVVLPPLPLLLPAPGHAGRGRRVASRHRRSRPMRPGRISSLRRLLGRPRFPRFGGLSNGGRPAAKLAICGLGAIGGGYALIGAGAHGRTLHRHALHAASGPTASGAIARGATATRSNATRAQAHTRSTASTRSGGRIAAPSSTKARGEFLPERARAAATAEAAASSQAPAGASSQKAAREFGIE